MKIRSQVFGLQVFALRFEAAFSPAFTNLAVD
jgi:hypothetical protein